MKHRYSLLMIGVCAVGINTSVFAELPCRCDVVVPAAQCSDAFKKLYSNCTVTGTGKTQTAAGQQAQQKCQAALSAAKVKGVSCTVPNSGACHSTGKQTCPGLPPG